MTSAIDCRYKSWESASAPSCPGGRLPLPEPLDWCEWPWSLLVFVDILTAVSVLGGSWLARLLLVLTINN